MIVRNELDFASVSYEAEKVAKFAHAAYWLHGHADASASFMVQERGITESVTKLAELLGFKLVPIAAPVKTGEAA